ncbi:MAG: DEAD/DEAH box helicase, partial [Chloroflexota bacterium]
MPEEIADPSAAAPAPARKPRTKKSAAPEESPAVAEPEAKPKRTRARKADPDASLAVADDVPVPAMAAEIPVPALTVPDEALDAIVAAAAADLAAHGEPEANEAFADEEPAAVKRESGAQRRARKKAEAEAGAGAGVEAGASGDGAAPAAAAHPAVPAARVTEDGETVEPAFAQLGLGEALQQALKDVGYEEPTPIQVQTIPVMLAGGDIIAQAQTGSGKTAAFGLPIIESIDPRVRSLQALILCPTRELAIQVAEALHKYGRHKEVETLPIYGGQPYERQFRGLQRGVQIVVGTPGRVMDHMRRGTLNLDTLRFFVLDEAEEMLDMGFIDDIEWILEHAPAGRQTALFSATMPPRIADLARQHLRDPQRITIAGREMTVPQIQQVSYEIPRARKVDALTRVLDAETPSSAMIFCRTKNQVDELGEALMARGYAVETLHGDLSQVQRDRVMRRFRGGQADILIATDVAARGLDIPDVSHVINYDIPDSAEAYVHR